MLNKQLINPDSIVVIGGSNDVKKPGGKIIKNIKKGDFKGRLFVVNPHEQIVQGLACLESIDELQQVDLAILVVPAKYCLDIVERLSENNGTKAFIILSAGFGEAGEDGALLESKIVKVVNRAGACLIGPNCIGVLNKNYNGIFTTPIPPLFKNGCDLISGSGATAVFIIEAGIPLGLKFNSIYSVGNAAQISVEDVLEYMDDNFDIENDSKIKLLYLESIKNPQKLLKHAASLIRKGAKIAAIKSGSTDAGSRAAASHTGALASSDMMVRALFDKAGIVYCSSREELISVASIFNYKALEGSNIAIITHAGGSAVMLADVLTSRGLNVPPIQGENAENLLKYLYNGSSVKNPIDFLATGTAEQLGIIIDYCEHKFDHIDAMVVVFGSPGLFDVENVYNVLSVKLDICTKPIYPVLPSLINAQKEIKGFLAKGNVNFPDEVVLGRALPEVYSTPKPFEYDGELSDVDQNKIRKIIDEAADGFLAPNHVSGLLDAANISRAKEGTVRSEDELLEMIDEFGFPIAMKVNGHLHKSDVGGVILNVLNTKKAVNTYSKLMKIEGANSVLIQSMHSGFELFVGVKKEVGFGHAILCGMGGVFIEILNDAAAALSPVSRKEAETMVQSLKSYKLFEGGRGKDPLDKERFIQIILNISALVEVAPEIVEMDINPLLASSDNVISVDARIRIEK
ncbi:MAG: CoA-binding protein [Crocinitomix sp.]|nr:CoA-binding protein [Crocinitomix sp.]